MPFFGAFDFIFFIIFALFIGVFISVIVRGVVQWNKNNHSPRLTVTATVVSKRMSISHHHHSANTMHTSTYTNYHVTFQFESGDRMELSVSGSEYGMLAEGDFGRLSFQGTRYLAFERT